MSSEAKHTDPLQTANTVAVVIHGIGDHRPIDILEIANACVTDLWKNRITTKGVRVLDLPIPPDVNNLGFGKTTEAPALEIESEGKRHIVIPFIWSGVRHRSASMASKIVGPTALWVALPLLFKTCTDLFSSIPKARGIWRLWVFLGAAFFLAVLAAFFLAFFYLQVNVPLWLGAPEYNVFDGGIVAIASFWAFSFLARYFSSAFDLVGDVAHYVAHPDERRDNISRAAALFEVVATRAAGAHIVIAGHSLGSVLVSQSLEQMTSQYAGRGRTVLLTMGSPLNVMSKAFPSQIQSPAQLAAAFVTSGVLINWINLWREQDIVGRALAFQSECFAEESLGTGLHSNYWGDERVWISVATILQALVQDKSPMLNGLWRRVPLSDEEQARSQAMNFKFSALRSFSVGVVIWAILFHWVTLSQFERQFSIVPHLLILAGWDLAFLPLALTAFLMFRARPWEPTRAGLHEAEFRLRVAKPIIIVTTVYLVIFAGVVAYKSGLLWH